MKKLISVGAILALSSLLSADNFIFISDNKAKAKKQLYKVESKLVPVEEVVINKPSTIHHGSQMMNESYWIQAGAFTKAKYALQRKDLVDNILDNVAIYEKDGYKRVVAGPFNKHSVITTLKNIKKEFPDAFLTTRNHFN